MLLAARKLCKTYKLPHADVPVLRDLDLEVSAGETVAVIGRSGAGKSTLLHALGGLERPQSGEVEIEGTPLYRGPERVRNAIRARKIGFVFQSYHLLPEMDLTENVMLPMMAIARLSRAKMRVAANELLAKVGLADRAAHKPLELSGGEQQRAALARALANNPVLILADEPTGNLDAATGAQITDLLFGLSKERGLALVMVTHSPQLASRCSRTLELRDGTLQCVSENTEL